MIHTPQQQAVFYTYINKSLRNPHLTLCVRSILKGAELNVKRSLEFIPECKLDKEDCYALLWIYRKFIPIQNKYVDNALQNIELSHSKSGLHIRKGQLNDHLTALGLPIID